MSYVCIKSARLTVSLSVETIEYTAIPKGRGYVCVANNQTYKRVFIYARCCRVPIGHHYRLNLVLTRIELN